jgi:centrosomal protein CEP350
MFYSCTESAVGKRQSAAPPQPTMHVPHSSAEVVRLIESAVDVLWPIHRDSKSREASRLSFVADHEDNGNTAESRGRAAYKRLIYDLSAQALSELCDDSLAHVDAATQPWLQPRLRVRVPVPATPAAARPTVCHAVLQRLGLQPNKPIATGHRHGSSKAVRRVRVDRVDELLLAELREEDAEWTDYTNDELYVKMQLADVLFDMLLSETVSTLNSIHQSRKS